MGETEFRLIAWAAALIEFGGTLVIVAYAALALGRLLTGRATIEATKHLVAQGVVSGLSWKLSATLLKTIELQSLDQVGAAFAILVIRHIVGYTLAAEDRHWLSAPGVRPGSSVPPAGDEGGPAAGRAA